MAKPHRRSASGMLGVITSARGKSSSSRAARALSWMRLDPLVATITGSTTMCSARYCRSLAAMARMIVGAGHHADLDRVGPDVPEHAVQLLGHELRGGLQHAGHPGGVLGGEGGEGAHAVHPQAGHGLEIRLDARAAAGVAARDGQHLFSYTFLLLFADKKTRNAPQSVPSTRNRRHGPLALAASHSPRPYVGIIHIRSGRAYAPLSPSTELPCERFSFSFPEYSTKARKRKA